MRAPDLPWDRIGLVVASSLLTFLVLFGIGELYRRYTEPYWTLDRALKYSSALFARHILTPGGQSARKRSHPDVTFRINRLGYRGPKIDPEGASVDTRVLVYGGSQVFDSRSPPPGWPRRVETLLRENGHEGLEVINAGIPGHSTIDAVGKLFTRGHFLNPDVVVLCNGWNDIKRFGRTDFPLHALKPYDRAEDPRRYYRNSLDRFLGQHSQFYTHLRGRFYSFLSDLGPEGRRVEVASDAAFTDTAVRQFKLNVRTFVSLARSIGARPILMVQPRLVSANNTAAERERIAYSAVGYDHDDLVRAFGMVDRVLRTVAQHRDVTLLDFSDELTGRGRYFFDHVHFNDRGSRKMARLVARRYRRSFGSSGGTRPGSRGED